METESKNAQVEPVPYIAHEAEMARIERANKRWFVAWLVTFVLFIASWAWFLYYESQWEVVETTEVTQDADGNGNNSYIGGNYYGKADSQDYPPPGS